MDSKNEIITLFWIGTITMVSLGFCLLFLVFFYQNYLSKIKRKEAENLLQIALESEHKERQRIASDLHDSVSGDLIGIRNYLVLISKKETDLEQKLLLTDLEKGVNDAIENTRQVSYKLMPPLLEHHGFVVAITDYFVQLTKNNGVSFQVVCSNESIEIEATKRYELFRVLQEFCTNMIKYGQISSCKLNIYKENDNTILELIDNGKSFDYKTALKITKGAGLKSINSRLHYIGARIEQKQVAIGNHFVINIL